MKQFRLHDVAVLVHRSSKKKFTSHGTAAEALKKFRLYDYFRYTIFLLVYILMHIEKEKGLSCLIILPYFVLSGS